MQTPTATAAMMRDYAAAARTAKSGKHRGYTAEHAERVAAFYDRLAAATTAAEVEAIRAEMRRTDCKTGKSIHA
jgi:hypothetical protein